MFDTGDIYTEAGNTHSNFVVQKSSDEFWFQEFFSRPIFVHGYSDRQVINQYSELLSSDLDLKKRHNKPLRYIILDLYLRRYQTAGKGSIGVFTSHGIQTSKDSMQSSKLKSGPRNVSDIVQGLEKNGYLERKVGCKGHSSKIRATPLLIRKMEAAGFDLQNYTSRRIWPIAYTKNTAIDVYADDVSFTKERVDISRPKADELGLGTMIHINSLAANSQISIGDHQFFPCEKQLRRIFTDESGLYNGRLYGPLWQNISSQARPFIEINGENTVEIDISSAHPLIAYAKMGYDLTDIISSEGRPYELEALDTENQVMRKIVKQALLTMFNASSKMEAVRALSYFISNDQCRGAGGQKYSLALRRVCTKTKLSEFHACEWIIDRLIEKHHRIDTFFFSESWKVLNKEESNICLGVVGCFSKMKSTLILPIHDSFIIPVTDYEFGVSVVKSALNQILKIDFKCPDTLVTAKEKTDNISMYEAEKLLLKARTLRQDYKDSLNDKFYKYLD
jgi:hypothetical protein